MKPTKFSPLVKLSAVLSVSLLAIALAGCSMFGANPSAPNAVDKALFNTTTNFVPVVTPAYVTNQQVVTQFTTNTQQVTAFATNVLGVTIVERVTNVVPVTMFQTNTVPVQVAAATNMVPQYTDTTKPAVTAGIQSAGSVINTFVPGVGGLVTTGLTALIGLFAYLRSSKNGTNLGATLAQEIQTIRNFVSALPNGAVYDSALTNFLQAHQADAGMLTQVLTLLKNEVSNPDATAAANGIIQTINTLSGVPTPPTPALSVAALHPIVAPAPLPIIPKPV